MTVGHDARVGYQRPGGLSLRHRAHHDQGDGYRARVAPMFFFIFLHLLFPITNHIQLQAVCHSFKLRGFLCRQGECLLPWRRQNTYSSSAVDASIDVNRSVSICRSYLFRKSASFRIMGLNDGRRWRLGPASCQSEGSSPDRSVAENHFFLPCLGQRR